MTGPVFVGVDGGGTKTEFVCIDAQDRVLGRSRTGTTYHLGIGIAAVEWALSAGFAALYADARIAPADVAHAFIGLPAFGEDSAVDPLLDAMCARVLGHRRYTCDNDMVCGWAGSLGAEDGINLVAGTGSIGYGRRQSATARIGGWGELFGDEGSAYWIAIQGLNAFSRMSDGRLPMGPLHAGFVAVLGLEVDLDLCARTLGSSGPGRDGIAALAPVVSAAADAGDIAALAILRQGACELAAMADTLRTRLGYEPGEPARLSWSGSVLSNVTPLRATFVDLLSDGARFTIVEPQLAPAEGAARYARRLAQVRAG